MKHKNRMIHILECVYFLLHDHTDCRFSFHKIPRRRYFVYYCLQFVYESVCHSNTRAPDDNNTLDDLHRHGLTNLPDSNFETVKI